MNWDAIFSNQFFSGGIALGAIAALVAFGRRLDVHIHFGLATHEQAEQMFFRFFPGLEEEAQAFAAALPEGVIPPAAIQEHLAVRSDDSGRAIAEAPALAGRTFKTVARGEAAVV